MTKPVNKDSLSEHGAECRTTTRDHETYAPYLFTLGGLSNRSTLTKSCGRESRRNHDFEELHDKIFGALLCVVVEVTEKIVSKRANGLVGTIP